MSRKIPESLAKMEAAVEAESGVLEFVGRYDEAVHYLRGKMEEVVRRTEDGQIVLWFAKKSHGMVELVSPASFVL